MWGRFFLLPEKPDGRDTSFNLLFNIAVFISDRLIRSNQRYWQIQKQQRSFMSRIVTTVSLLTLVVTLNAGQLTLGDWDFTGLESFPTASSTQELGWVLEVETGAGIEIVEINRQDWGQYDLIYNGTGLLYLSFHNCPAGNSGADFECNIPDDSFVYHLSDVVVKMPDTFNSYCGNSIVIEPDAWELADCYPNPFNPETTVEFTLAEPCQVTITLHNMSGQYVRSIVDSYHISGSHSVVLDGADLASGVYTVSMRAGGFFASQRITLLK